MDIMQESPLVSVIMPVYNSSKYLRHAVDSILRQHYTNIELVIVNDASTDDTRQIIMGYNDSRIRYFENTENIGIVRTRNICIGHTRGKYIALLDHDDIAKPHRLLKQVEYMEHNLCCGICGTYAEIIDSQGRIFRRRKAPLHDREIRTQILFVNCFVNSGVMIRADKLRHDHYNVEYDRIEDYYFIYQVSKSATLAVIPDYAIQYRMHQSNESLLRSGTMRYLKMKMDLEIMAELGINFSDREIELHSNLFSGNFTFFSDAGTVNELEDWLIKMYNYLKEKKQYDMLTVVRIFSKRWVRIFIQNRKIQRKIILNKLIREFGLYYLLFALDVVKDKFTKTIVTY